MKTYTAIDIVRNMRPVGAPRRKKRSGPKTTVRGDKIRKFVVSRKLETIGFRRALKRLVTEFCEGEYDEDEFREWFGDLQIIPAAFSIEREGDGVWDTTIHVYEVEDSNQISKDRIAAYGRMADGEGPLVTLHIIDRFGTEHVMTNDLVECFAFYPSYHRHNAEYAEKYTDEILRNVRSAEKLPAGKRTSKWKAAYDALREMGIEI